jgi:membrane-bound lytic murein transglycosylase D
LKKTLKRLIACLSLSLLAAACTDMPAQNPAGASAPSKGSASQPAATAGKAPAGVALNAPPIGEAEALKDLVLPRTVDLTRPADDLWERIRQGFAMPNLDSPLVAERQRWYSSQPEYVARMVARSKLYLYYVVEEVQKRGMPTEIALLPMVESAYNPMAYSRSHASGLWQFIPSTGKNYKLNQNWWSDSRRDIVASTNAALDYLQALYDMHGDWQLALASYNWGENAVARAIAKNKAHGLPTDYLSLKMPPETRGYIPKLQALKDIIANPELFGLTLDPIPNEPYFVTVPTEKDIDVRLAAKLAEMPEEELIALNPALNRPVISGPHTQVLVLPADRVDAFRRNLEAYDAPLISWLPYNMKRGDTLDRLAAKHGIALAKLKTANGITSKTRVGPGYQLLLPVKGSGAAAEPLPVLFKQPVFAPAHRGYRYVYVVKKGDTLYGIARKYRVSTDSLRKWNHISMLTTGQKIFVYGKAPTTARKKAVKAPVKISAAEKPKQNVVATVLPEKK